MKVRLTPSGVGGSEKGGRVTGDKTFEARLSAVLELHTRPQGQGFCLEQAPYTHPE